MPKVQAVEIGGQTRLGRGRRVSTSLAEINVVPLVDVMLVLLIIFMITAPMIQRGMDVKIPVSRRAQEIQGERLFVTVPLEYHTSRMLLLGSDRIRADALSERVRQKVETLADKKVYLQGDGGVMLQDVMDVFDRLRDAGVLDVGIVAKGPNEK